MESRSALAVSLLQVGNLMGLVVLTQAVAVSRLPVDAIPTCLRHRVDMSNRLRPLLGASAVVMALTGLVLQLR